MERSESGAPPKKGSLSRRLALVGTPDQNGQLGFSWSAKGRRQADTQAAHVQLTGELAAMVHTGELPAGARLPPERVMCQQLGVSRTTLRQVLDRLEERHLITRHVGRGTFIAEAKLEHRLDRPLGMADDTSAEFSAFTYKTLAVERMIPDEAMRSMLMLPNVPHIVRVVRVRLLGDEVQSIESNYLSESLYDEVGGEHLKTSFPDAYRAIGRAPTRMRQRLEPVLAQPWEAEVLEVPVRSPIMLVSKRSWDESGVVLEYAQEHHRADRNSFLVEVTSRSSRTVTVGPDA